PEADHPMDASTHLLKGANAVAIGFDLDDATCVSLLAEWDVLNAVRPYPVKELERKVREARAHPHWPKGYPHVFGYLLAKSEQTPRSKHSTTGAPKGGEPGAESPASDAEPAENAGDETPEQITRFRWNPIDSATFATGNYRPHWLVERLLVQGQPGVIGGPQKSLKTTLMIALAISIASGKPFLGVFKVYKPCRVAVISGESGEYVLQETAQRICHALGVNLADLGIKWLFRLPQMGSLADLTALQAGLKRDGIEVVFIDPLYLSLLTGEGAKGKEASNLFDTGPLLMKVGQLCLSAGATPIPCHHTGKPLAKSREPLELSDLAYSGIAEYARQWLLTSRKERFKPDTGKHKLWLVGGGCAGQSGCWEVDVDEGRLRNDFTGRIWEVTVTPASEAREDDAKVADDSKDRAKAAEVRKDAAKVLAILKQEDPQSLGFGCTTARALASLSGDRMTRAVAKLVADQLVEELDLPCDMPKGGTKGKRGIRWLKNP
ncbi:MAG TPA: AAA family ATPase, partial [Gemmataceae bacterium]|nr:AAA family ATPase [Gemmataceae bacterium]